MPVSGNTLTIPVINETSRAAGSRVGGVRAYWVAEAGAITDSKPALAQIELKLKKVAAMGYVTEEMMADAPAAGAIMQQAFQDELAFEAEQSILRGTGAGQPLGILSAPCLVSVAIETNQTAATIWGPNIVKMWARMPATFRRNAVWLVNQDVETQLWGLAIEGRYGSVSTAADAIPLFYPAGSLLNAGQYGSLMGRPVIPVEYCSTLGTVGDIVLADLSQYIVIDKGGVQTAESIHVRFAYDERTFRATYRIDGQPWHRSAITPANGSNTQSPFVALATR